MAIFGSFGTETRLAVLDGLIGHLQSAGYTRADRIRSVEGPRRKDVDILTECLSRASDAAVAIFVLFSGADEPNQSTLIELQARAETRTRTPGSEVTAVNTALLPQKDVPLRALLRGLLARHEITTTDPWRTTDELYATARGVLLPTRDQ